MEPDDRPAPPQRPALDIGRSSGFGLGPVGATAAIAAIAAIVITTALAFVIPRIVERHLLDATAGSIERTVDAIATLIGGTENLSADDVDDLQAEIEHALIGREIVRVKIWDRSGTIVVSDEERLIGETYEMADDLLAAFDGETIYGEPDFTRPENRYEADLGDLREYYVPVHNESGQVEFVFEVYEMSGHIPSTVGQIRTAVWIALGVGTAILLAALGAAGITNARAEKEQRERSRRLIGQLLEIQEAERTRIVGSLHDDVGQPLYRIMFGLQASRKMVEEGSAAYDELTGLEELVRQVDTTLRNELTTLRQEPGVEIDLESALTELIEVVEADTGLDIDFAADTDRELPLAHRATLYRAAKEALTNVDRHANARRVSVRLVEGRDTTMIEVLDDGTGSVAAPGLGLTTTRDRLEAIGGGIVVSEARHGGTRFVAWVPNEPEESA